MVTYLHITFLNGLVFCPYSVYLHQVFDNNYEDLYNSNPQQLGKTAHIEIDSIEFEEPDKIKGHM